MPAPALSVGVISNSGAGSVEDGRDRYQTSLALESSLSDQAPIAFIRVGRQIQPIGLAGFHVSADPNT